MSRRTGRSLLGLIVAVLGFAPVPGAAAVGPALNGKLAFVSDRDSNGGTNEEIYVMNADGSGQARLTFVAGYDADPAWSPDGTKIAFSTFRGGGLSEIYVMNADGSGQTNLTNHADGDSQPVWSPDGTKIAFTRFDDNDEIYVMNADGSGQTNLTNHSLQDSEPAWSPDGTKIAFRTDRDGPPEVYVMNADGSGQANLTNDTDQDSHPAWSPDGTRIAFVTPRDGNSEIYVMNADGSGQANVTNVAASGEDQPAWSPDGTKIAFRTDRDGGSYEIYVMNADGSGQTNVSNFAAEDFQPAWQPVPIPDPVVSRARAKEGKPARFKVSLPGPLSEPVTYDFETRKGKAKAGKDFKKKDGTVTFAPGETRKKIKVKTKDDGKDERKETFLLDVSFPGGPSDTGKARIIDND